jgi:ABC-type phosphate transport system substrate-binding protein
MGIYARVRHLALVAICASGLVAGIGMAAAPGSALAAKVKCVAVTGSGSSLQAEQQTKWTGIVNPATFVLKVGTANECEAFANKVTYTATSSGQGLEEFGLQENAATKKFEVNKTKSGNGTTLDAFVGTDDPPTEAALKEAATASGTSALVVPTVAAPVAIVLHPPVGCLNLTYPLNIPNSELSSVFSKTLTWDKVLLQSGATIDELTAGACSSNVLVEVRSDASGTSFATKQYLCQVNSTTWGSGGACESGDGFVSDAVSWPGTVDTTHIEGGKSVENKGSKGEAEAVKLTAGSIGYVNLANAVQAGFLPTIHKPTLAAQHLLIVATVQNKEEPVKTTENTKGNCPTSYTFAAGVKVEAEASKWAKVHLANAEAPSGAYPLCTFTYDVGWANYKATVLEGVANYNGLGTETGATAQGYFEYMTKTGASEGQGNVENYYSPLPTSVQTVAEVVAKKVG